MYYVPRGGTRGGADQFKWDDVKSDKDRECYLGHSLMAPVGRWQKGKDLQWFNKDRDGGQQEMLNEIEAAKQAEKEALMTALGQKVPKAPKKQPVPQPKQTQEDRESRKPSKSKNGPLLKAGLSLERTAALLRAEKTSKSKKKRKAKKEKKKKSKDKKKKKRRKQESSDSSSDSSEDSDSSSDEDSFRKQKRPTKQSSSHQKRTRLSSHSEEEERRITSRRLEQSRHQSHTRHENHESYRRSHSYDKQQSRDVGEEDRQHRAKGKGYFVDGNQARNYGKRQSRDTSSEDEDRHSRSKGKGYGDDRKELRVKGHSADSGRHGPTHGRVNHRHHSASDSSDGDYTSRQPARSQRFENHERSRGKGQDSNLGHSLDRRAHKRKPSPSSDSTDEDDPRQSRTAVSHRYPGDSPDRHNQRSRTPEHTRRHDLHNRKYDHGEKDRKYSRSPNGDRDNRWRDDGRGSSSRSESRRESRGYYK